jgi:hypothetical protein
LSDEKAFEKNLMDMKIDIDSTLHVADRVNDFLDASMKNPFERYVVARLISILYEEKWDFSLDPKFEAEVRKLAQEKPEKSHVD